jgi:SAM-dependent methyltransferase
MCDANIFEFFIEEASENEFNGKGILEVGSKYVNGSIRPLVERFLAPENYVGVDIEPGKYVDVVISAENLANYFGPESFDVVISTELIEHVNDWRKVVGNMKEVLKPAGNLYITTRSKGMPFHAHPYDFWRFEVDDMKKIFSDFEIIRLRKDHGTPGVFLKCRKPLDWVPTDLERISLYSMVLDRRTTSVPNAIDMPLTRKAKLAGIGIGRKISKYFRTVL